MQHYILYRDNGGDNSNDIGEVNEEESELFYNPVEDTNCDEDEQPLTEFV